MNMEKETHSDAPVEHPSNTVTQPVLRTNVTLCDDDLSEEAKAQFGFHTEILRAFQLTARIVLANVRFVRAAPHWHHTPLQFACL
jgi:hypothetical protein